MIEDGVNIKVVPTDVMVANHLSEENSVLDAEAEEKKSKLFHSSLAAHILREFQQNKDTKRDSGIEQDITDSGLAYNGEYSPTDLAKIRQENGSSIFMNITATKCKTAKSWISDILQPANERAWSLDPSPSADLPTEVLQQIEESIVQEFEAQEAAVAQEVQQQQPGQQGSPLAKAQETMRELNQKRRDIQNAMFSEIDKEAKFQLKVLERQIDDQLQEGGWDEALSNFIQDFCIYPTAFMKGPIITKKQKLTWVNGKPSLTEEFVFKNERVNPLDIYPSGNADSLQDGNLLEHVRYHRDILAALRGLPGYIDEAINNVLIEHGINGTTSWIDSSIEDEKADLEKRGDSTDANRGIIHGLHFFGTASATTLKEWGLSVNNPCFDNFDDNEEIDIEAILVGEQVIKCVLNDDPLGRRPYYCASFLDIPGSVWGRSLPNLMNDIQRICNATARALANNLGIASGPQVQVLIDRLADNGDIDEIYPMKIWQMTSDPVGNGGQALQFFQPDSNAAELLAVYEKFESKADDATGIPKYAYGNERLAGAGTTASGLSMLLESSSKTIKDCVRNIDNGLIKKRVESQFYYNLLKNKDLKFTGDVNVVPKGSATLTVKGAQALRRNEFLQITANPIDQQIMGVEGRAVILRVMAEDLGLPVSDVIPDVLDLRKRIKEQQQGAQQAQQMEMQAKQQEKQIGLQATQMQVEGQMQMHQGSTQLKALEIASTKEEKAKDREVEVMKVNAKQTADMVKESAKLQTFSLKEQGDTDRQEKELAVKRDMGTGI